MTNKLANLALAILLALPALATLAPAALAQDTVPVAPTVPWRNQVNHLQSLYLSFADIREQTATQTDVEERPDCLAATAPPTLETRKKSEFQPGTTNDPRPPCAFTTSIPGQPNTPQSSVTFAMKDPLRKSFNVTGNTSLVYVHEGTIPAGVTLRVELRHAGTPVSTIDVPSGNCPCVKAFELGPTSHAEFKRNERLSLAVSATSATPASWTLEDTGSRLEVRAIDALRAATWVQDEKDVVRDLFRPLARETDSSSRLVGFFAVQSAFGLDDAAGYRTLTNIVPQFSMERGGRPVPLGAGGTSTLAGDFNESTSQDVEGRAIWNFPQSFLDYRGMEAGEYNLTVDMPYHQGGSIREGILKKVLLTTQSVLLTPFDDTDPATSPSPLETSAHDVASGQSTTYVFLVRNTGSVNDTFQIDATLVSGAPAGWSAVVGGPDVTDRRILVPPNDAKIATVTVTAPAGAATGSTSIFQVQAASTVDPQARSTATTVVSTVSNFVRPEVRIIQTATESNVIPGEDTRIPVYVWNRGTRIASIALEVRGTILQDWSVRLAQGDEGTSRLIVPSVPAGGIVRADLVVRGPGTQSEGTQEITLNATQTDVGGTSFNHNMKFTLTPVSGVRVEVLDRILGTEHFLELTGNFTFTPGVGETPGTGFRDPLCDNPDTARRGSGCFDDGVDGAWYRVWVTNTGRRTEQFDLTYDSIVKTGCVAPFGTNDNAPQFFVRDDRGNVFPRSFVNLKPGQTGEVYLWRPIDRIADCKDPGTDDFRDGSYSFSVNARGPSGVIGRSAGKANVVDNKEGGSVPLVYLEHATRLAPFGVDTPYVDIANATKRSITTGIEVNTSQIRTIRLTNGASWATYTDPSTERTFNSDAKIMIAGVDREGGWNVSMRKTNVDPASTTNFWVDTLTFSNQENPNNRREGWMDFEVEVRIEAPRGENGTGLAGEQDHFTITATLGDASSTLEFKAVVTELVNLTLETDLTKILAHPGSAGAGLVYVNNTGSSDAIINLKAALDPTVTPNAGAWSIEPAAQPLTLPAFKNQTVALLVTPPSGAVSGEIVVTAEYAPDPLQPGLRANKTLRIPVDVVPRGSLTLASTVTDVTIAPGGFANYTLQVVNTGSLAINYRASATSIPNWTATLSPTEGTLAAGETRNVIYVLKAPNDVVNGTRFQSIVQVQEIGNTNNFDIRPVAVNILGGRAIASISVPKIDKTVDRNGVQYFEVAVKNIGSATGRIDLSVRSADPNWGVGIQTLRGDPISFVTLAPNELQTVNVTVRAPLNVPENTRVLVEVIAEAGGQAAQATLQALVHDYALAISLNPSRIEAIVGTPSEFVITIRNTGNDNDTLNVSAQLLDIPEWRVDMSLERVRLEPGQSTDVRAVVRQPASPLATPRPYTLKFFAGTVGGQAVNIPKNDSVAAIVDVLNYRPMDVDRDDLLEVAVDFDRNPNNGFEVYREIFPEGVQTVMVANGRLDNKARFFLDVPRDRPADGIADVWFDPETVYAYEIQHAPDLNFDNAPDYLLDTNRDGKVDRAFDSVTQRYLDVLEIKAYGDDRIQYLADTNLDGRPDRFYDPGTRIVTRTQNVAGEANLVGLDTDNDGDVDKHYDVNAKSVADARLSNAGGFFIDYWYVIVAFILLVIVTIVLVVRRRRA